VTPGGNNQTITVPSPTPTYYTIITQNNGTLKFTISPEVITILTSTYHEHTTQITIEPASTVISTPDNSHL